MPRFDSDSERSNRKKSVIAKGVAHLVVKMEKMEKMGKMAQSAQLDPQA